VRSQIANKATPVQTRLKMLSELYSRYAFPFASLVFAFIAVPLGIQNRRSGKSAGFSVSIGILLVYYLMLSLLRTLAEKGSIPPFIAVWLPNMIFLGIGWYLLRMSSLQRTLPIPSLTELVGIFNKGRVR
jgi:lipopolysaccharide export system permease protein